MHLPKLASFARLFVEFRDAPNPPRRRLPFSLRFLIYAICAAAAGSVASFFNSRIALIVAIVTAIMVAHYVEEVLEAKGDGIANRG